MKQGERKFPKALQFLIFFMKLANKSIPNVPESKFHNTCYRIYQIYFELISIFMLREMANFLNFQF